MLDDFKKRKQNKQNKEQKKETKQATLVAAANKTKSRVNLVSHEDGEYLRIEPIPISHFFKRNGVHSFWSIQLITSPILALIFFLYYLVIQNMISSPLIIWISSGLLAYATIVFFFLLISRITWRPFCMKIIDGEFVFLNYNLSKIINSASISNLHYKLQKYPSNGWASLIITSSTFSKKIAYLNYKDTDSLIKYMKKSNIAVYYN